jgi:hypothetical protein
MHWYNMHWSIWILAAAIALAAYHLLKHSEQKQRASDDSDWHEWPEVAWPDTDLRGSGALKLDVITVKFDGDPTKMRVGDVAVVNVFVNGSPAPVATKCQWAMDVTGIVTVAQSTTTPGLNKITAVKTGTVRLVAILAQGVYAWPPLSVTVSAAVVPVPPPMPPVLSPAPAAKWSGLFQPVRIWMTDFYYNWTTAMYAIVAAHYDLLMSMKHPTEIKALNANARNLVYALQYTTLIDKPVAGFQSLHEAATLNNGSGLIRHYLRAHEAHKTRLLNSSAAEASPELARSLVAAATDAANVATKYLADFETWRHAHGISDADAEAAFLHDSTGKRIVPYLWASPRNVFDTRSAVARTYTIDRLMRVAAASNIDGIFLDELGKGVMEPVWKLATGANAPMLQAIENAEVSLLAAIRQALATVGKQLVVNTASYAFSFDAACADAAGGTHMEQTNNPLQGDLTASTWSFIDARLAKGTIVNLVPPFQFGEYESQVGGAGVTHMDTPRGKLLELVSALMVSVNPASLLWLSLENGDWSKYTPITNWLKQIDAIAKFGLPVEKRHALPFVGRNGAARRCYQRSFEHGLAIYNAIYFDVWNKSSQDYGGDTVTVTLPTDRNYFRVQPDGTVELKPTTSVMLRTPEAAIFVCP